MLEGGGEEGLVGAEEGDAVEGGAWVGLLEGDGGVQDGGFCGPEK